MSWPLPQRIAFRFAFVYLLLHAAPWGWFDVVPGAGALGRVVERGIDLAVRWSNASLFHVRETLVPPNGSGDTSWAWARLWLFLLTAAVAAVAWSAVDRKRTAYPRALYWMRTVLRYYLALFALSYGIIKLFVLQMGFPTQSQMLTPLGDFLPMRVEWMVIGYSAPYQFFSGAVETAAGVLLLWRPTVTLGLLAAAAAFGNVFMINVAYDVPVKLFSFQLFMTAVVLLSLDAPRLLAFLVLNRGAGPTRDWEPAFTDRRAVWGARGIKALFVWEALLMPLWNGRQSYVASRRPPNPVPFAVGVYDVPTFVRGRDTIPLSLHDTLRWRDVAIDATSSGSVGATDTTFWQRYRRGYFRFKADTSAGTLAVWRSSWLLDSTHVFTARYEVPQPGTVRLRTVLHGESLFVELTRSARHFQLSERQFHWLSEYNR